MLLDNEAPLDISSMQANTNLIVLGGFELSVAELPEPVPLARKAKALLAFLALNLGRAQTRDKLSALLWDESAEVQARQSLRQALVGLRKAFPKTELLVTDKESVTLIGLDVDALVFEKRAAGTDSADLEQAVSLYRGDLLEGFNAGSDAYEDWLLTQRSRYRQLAISAMSRLLETYLQESPGEPALGLAHQLLALDPLLEPAHRALMRLYAGLGRNSEAMRQFRRCRRLLWRELDVEPEPETARLYSEIRALRKADADPVPQPEFALSDEDVEGTPPQVPVRPEATEPQLRQVTLVGIDWVPPQRMVEGDHESLRDLEARFRAQVEDAVRRFQGQVLREAQDSALIAFGVPRARSDDPERALRAALHIGKVQATGSEGSIRAVLDCGQGLWEQSHDSQSLSGPVLHRCKELKRAAEVGKVLITDAVYRRLRRWAVAQPLEIAGESVWCVEALSSEPCFFATRFVGRQQELGLLVSALDACADTRTGHNFLVRGEAGIGKTRLIEELRCRADEVGFAVDLVRVLDFGAGLLQDPLSRLIMGLLGLSLESSREEIEAALKRAMDLGHLDRSCLAAIRPLLGLSGETAGAGAEALPPDAREQALRDALTELLMHVTEVCPRLLVVEDIHWASPLVLSLLAVLAEATSRCAAILVISSRFEGEALDPRWRASMHGAPLTTLDLGALRMEQALALARKLVPEDENRARLCAERSEGNPLFLEQLLINTGGGEAAVPDSVQSIVLSRLDGLPEGDRKALQAASVLGQRFGLDCLRELIQEPDYDGQRAMLGRLLRPEGSGLMFNHALIRDAVYGSVPASRRRLLHRAAADWYRATDPVLNAYHLGKAGAKEAAAAYLRAAQNLFQQTRYDQVLSLVDETLSLAPDQTLLNALHRLAGHALLRSGRVQQAQSEFNEALACATSDDERGRTLLGLAGAHSMLDDPNSALECLDRAAVAGASAGNVSLDAEIRFQRGNVLFSLARLDECLETHSALAEDAKRSGTIRHEALAEGGLGDAFYLRGQMVTAHRHFSRCVELARTGGFLDLLSANLAMTAWTAFYQNRLGEGVVQAQEALRIAQENYDVRGECIAYIVFAPMMLCRGDFDHARETGERALELARRVGSQRFEADGLWTLAETYGTEGDRSRAVSLLHQALRSLGEVGIPFGGALVLSLLARFTSNPKQRCSYLAQGEEYLARETISHNFLEFHKNAIEVWLEEREWDRIEDHALALENYTRNEPLPWARFIVARGRALADAGRGKRDPALARELSELLAEGRAAQFHFPSGSIETALERITR